VQPAEENCLLKILFLAEDLGNRNVINTKREESKISCWPAGLLRFGGTCAGCSGICSYDAA
jgi:hypothetical protein